MDSLTQMALGGVIAEAGFREKLGGKAVILGCLGGALPDLDILTGIVLKDSWIQMHLSLFVRLVQICVCHISSRWTQNKQDWVVN